jgi:hypothetical protein
MRRCVIDGGLPSLMLARRRERFLFWHSVLPLIACWGGSSRRSLGRGDRVDRVLHYSLLRGDDFPRQGSLGRVKGEIFLALVANLGDYGCYRCNDRARLGELAARIQMDSPLVRLALLSVTGAAT